MEPLAQFLLALLALGGFGLLLQRILVFHPLEFLQRLPLSQPLRQVAIDGRLCIAPVV